MAPAPARFACRLFASLLLCLSVSTAKTTAQVSAGNKGGPRPVVEGEFMRGLVFEGSVTESDGTPVCGAVVVTNAGGEAVTDAHGSYRLRLALSLDAGAVQVTAVGPAGGGSLASRRTVIPAGVRIIPVPPIVLGPKGPCQASWLPTFGEEPGTQDDVTAVGVYDDGRGRGGWLHRRLGRGHMEYARRGSELVCE